MSFDQEILHLSIKKIIEISGIYNMFIRAHIGLNSKPFQNVIFYFVTFIQYASKPYGHEILIFTLFDKRKFYYPCPLQIFLTNTQLDIDVTILLHDAFTGCINVPF